MKSIGSVRVHLGIIPEESFNIGTVDRLIRMFRLLVFREGIDGALQARESSAGYVLAATSSAEMGLRSELMNNSAEVGLRRSGGRIHTWEVFEKVY